ncbi:MAG TPA: hypothetical protein QGI72_02260 [Poseidonia sp.]|nr:hypothetical protein [Poseidonia sp.]
MSWKRHLLGFVVTLAVIFAAWSMMVVSYEDDLGTENRIRVTKITGQQTNNSDDALATLNFEKGAEPLAWSSLQLSMSVAGEEYSCTFGSQSTESDGHSPVLPVLGADGLTFQTQVDASQEDEYTFLDVPNQKSTNESEYTLRFSKTDVFMSEGIRWQFIEGESIENDFEIDENRFSNATDDRLEWYTYDLAVHRVMPNDGVYIFEQQGQRYKVQFLTYYNDDDESRYPTMLISSTTPESFPALKDPMLVSQSPCLISTTEDDQMFWNGTEEITLLENGVNICDVSCDFTLVATYEGVKIRIVQNKTSGA